MPHEELTLLFMHRLNEEFNGKLDLAIRIFSNTYPWRFLHQLVSSQLDMDRLDFLKRDSFYTGVSEGVINTERIIEMLDVVDDELVVEEKGIYSIEKFIVARRLMYWQVYLHKTVIAAEKMLLRLLERAHTLSHQGHDLFMTPALAHFIRNNYSEDDFRAHPALLDHFALIDDFDIFTSVKVWATHPDNVLRILAQGLLLRHLFRIEIQKEPFDAGYIDMIRANVAHHYGLPEDSLSYFVFTDEISNKAYDPFIEHIRILFKNGQVTEIEETSDQLNIALLTRKVTKYYLCYPKNCLVTH
jgi:hypothetical protein